MLPTEGLVSAFPMPIGLVPPSYLFFASKVSPPAVLLAATPAPHEHLQGIANANEFSQGMQTVAQAAELSYRHTSMAHARSLLATALVAQIEVGGDNWARA